MKFSAIWRLLAALWRLCLVYGIPAILFWTMSIYWFVNGKSGLGLITGTLAALTTILWYYFVREVDKKEKELAEKDQPNQSPKKVGLLTIKVIVVQKKRDNSTEEKQKG